jgi:hypothetical protein
MNTPQPQHVQEPLLGGRYRLARQIGAGGMGAVFEAYDGQLQRRVAIKMLPEELQTDHVARERLRGEALAAAALDHPFICKIHELGETDGRLFVVMEYVEGETLHALAAQSLLPMRQIVELITEIVEALDEAHRRGLVHRDLKPSNIMLTAQGHVKVMDFGLAKQVVGIPEGASFTATPLTGAGMRVGTPTYMSPEQVLGASLDARSDIFSLGIVLYELATGSHPFLRPDSAETMAAILRDAPTGGRRDLETLPGLRGVVYRMLAKACAERPQSMRELRVELEALRERAWRSSTSNTQPLVSEAQTPRTPFVGPGSGDRRAVARLGTYADRAWRMLPGGRRARRRQDTACTRTHEGSAGARLRLLRNIHGAFVALEVFVQTLALLGDRERCGSLYPLALLDVQSELRYSPVSLGPISPSLLAAIAADAAGLAERAEEHFEVAAREARELPIRLLQPTVLVWRGRSLAGRREPAERERGRAMVAAALKDFRALEMILHARLAEQFLRTI